MRKLSIRMIVNGLGVGGTETHLSRVLPTLVQQTGWQIRVILFSAVRDLAPQLESAGIPVWSPPRLDGLPAVLRQVIQTACTLAYLGWDFIRDRTSITHFWLPKAYLLGMLMACVTALPAPKYLSRRSLNTYQARYPGVRRVERWLHRWLTAILVNSLTIKQELIDTEGVTSDRIVTIYNGLAPVSIDEEEKARYRQYWIEQEGLPSDTWILICVANLIPYKGHQDILQALAKLSEQDLQGRPCRLLCVGSDEGSGYAAKLRQLAFSLGIADKVRWLGKHRDILSLYAAADIALLCSHQEGLSNAVLEAMAVGLPLVVTQVGGNTELVQNGETGWVVPVQDPEAIQLALSRLFQNDRQRRVFGLAGQTRANMQFSLAECVLGYERLYRQYTVTVTEAPTGIAGQQEEQQDA